MNVGNSYCPKQIYNDTLGGPFFSSHPVELVRLSLTDPKECNKYCNKVDAKRHTYYLFQYENGTHLLNHNIKSNSLDKSLQRNPEGDLNSIFRFVSLNDLKKTNMAIFKSLLPQGILNLDKSN